MCDQSCIFNHKHQPCAVVNSRINVEHVFERHDHLALAARQYDTAGQRDIAVAYRIAMRRSEGFER